MEIAFQSCCKPILESCLKKKIEGKEIHWTSVDLFLGSV